SAVSPSRRRWRPGRMVTSPLADRDRERIEAAQQEGLPARGLARSRDLREPAQQPGERHRALEPGQRGADAEVRTAAETERAAVRAGRVEPVRLGAPA